jgi:hypothetical protein
VVVGDGSLHKLVGRESQEASEGPFDEVGTARTFVEADTEIVDRHTEIAEGNG